MERFGVPESGKKELTEHNYAYFGAGSSQPSAEPGGYFFLDLHDDYEFEMMLLLMVGEMMILLLLLL